jgi:hypothetical protein
MALSKKSNTGKDPVKKTTKKPANPRPKIVKPKEEITSTVVIPEDKPTPTSTKMITEGGSPSSKTGIASFLGSLLSKGKSVVVSLLKGIKPIYLLLGCVVLSVIVYFWFSKPDTYKQENKRLKNEIIQIQKQRDKIADSIKTLKYEYTKLEDSANIKLQLLDEINQRMVLIEQRVSTSFDELSKIKNGVNGLNAQIKSATEKPIKRVGDDLINSLKNKIN